MIITMERSLDNQTTKTNQLTLIQAVNDGLRTMLKEDERVLLLGEDIGKNGGVFRATEALQEQFGEERVIDTPEHRSEWQSMDLNL